ncbi:MAG: hypothetical protein L0I29_07900 [Hyphomicrobiales bacterium]|nr:hypothetical protein [Hyphomicrobiales bacterium]
MRLEALIPGLRRGAVALCAASVVLLVVMIVLEFFYFQRLSGGLSSLGMRLSGFSSDDAVAWLTALGEPGREAVLVWQYSSFDLFFPAIFGLALLGLFLNAASRSAMPALRSKRMQIVAGILVVVPYVLANYAQNVFIVRMLSDPSAASIWLTSVASMLVMAKFVLALAAIAVIAVVFRQNRGRL